MAGLIGKEEGKMAKAKRPRRRSGAAVDAMVQAQLETISPETTAAFSAAIATGNTAPDDAVYSISPNRKTSGDE
ncbi:hypothetical protein CCC_03164 [Paramagnetospirillum magnetotacticum MS-1]|uniref:Uncharacterized protein n=1 Tax=Paramagnetospirillum magnetotacticum MS-1 TaxID=272627 RepID=A0A0C2V671_PARME|nr:hypothetical protein [Paramagnetospirillum magnetotacticum]KIM00562.1 hypothetical protein CCC_03164 [Paramagnetospirillum magnetotacticum MS-1]